MVGQKSPDYEPLLQLEELRLSHTWSTRIVFCDPEGESLQVRVNMVEKSGHSCASANHKFRKLSDFQVGKGDATGALSPSLAPQPAVQSVFVS
jgi:hypothetical protein